MFSYNKITGEIKEGILEKCDTVTFYGKPIYPNKIKIEPDCYYEQALNKKNFIKRLKRIGMLINDSETTIASSIVLFSNM